MALDVATIRGFIDTGFPGTANSPSVREIRDDLTNPAADVPPVPERARAAADPQPGAVFISQPPEVSFPLLSGNFQAGLQSFADTLAAYEATAQLAQNAHARSTGIDVEA